MFGFQLSDFRSGQASARDGLEFRRRGLFVVGAHEVILQSSALRLGRGLRFGLGLGDRRGGTDRNARRDISVVPQLPNISPRGSASLDRLELRSRGDF